MKIAYDPQPPFDAGAPEKADASTLRLTARMLMGDAPLRTLAGYSSRMVGDRLRGLRRAAATATSSRQR
jgi:hypothetical protein